ncbi:MAG: flagellar filament capping protein FliD [Oscillospiraceae bacterium]|nr:flagellar filament capping protein FliD [Oscillospiraceae bacterium]
MPTVQNTQRITGLFSGMDTDMLVKGMMVRQQMQLDKLNQKMTLSEWKRDTITDFNSRIRQFVDNFGSVLGKNSLMLKSSYVNFATEMARNTTAFSVNGTASAKAGAYSLRVDQIATAASAESARVTTASGGLTAADMNKSLNQLTGLAGGRFNYSASDEFSFSVNGTDFTFRYGDSLNKIMDTVNKSGAGVTLSYSQITDTFSLTGGLTGASSGLENPGEAPVRPEFTLTAPNVDAYGGAEDPSYIDDMADYNRQRAAYEADLASYNLDLQEYNQSLTAFNEDSKRGLTLDDTDNFLSFFGFGDIRQGQDAIVSVNGGPAMNFSSNQFELDGLEFNLNRITGGETFEFSVVRNTGSAVDNIKSFVEEFNDLIKTFFDAHTEKKNFNFSPLTEAQKQELSDKEIEEWEAKARSGLMARDNRLGTMLNEMRRMVGEVLGGEDRLASIGITAAPYRVGEAWSLNIDEAKLTKALEENSDAVFNILGASERTGGGGFVSRLSKAMEGYVTSTKSADLQNLTSSISAYSRRIKEQETKMYTMSEKYYMQYATLESALSQMQSQTDQMMTMFGFGQQK